jgi:hypothetical protein
LFTILGELAGVDEVHRQAFFGFINYNSFANALSVLIGLFGEKNSEVDP